MDFKEFQGLLNEMAPKVGGTKALYSQVDSFWKSLDEMSENDPNAYKEFIDSKIKPGLEEMRGKEKIMENIQGEPLFSMRFHISRIKTPEELKINTPKDIKTQEGIEQMREIGSSKRQTDSFLEEPKIYLNLCTSDRVLPPITKSMDIADPNNDKTWSRIPMSLSKPGERESLMGLKCLHYDGFIHPNVGKLLTKDADARAEILSYLFQTFERSIQQFELHIKSVKFIKKRKYKGANLKIFKPQEHELNFNCSLKYHQNLTEKINTKKKAEEVQTKNETEIKQKKKDIFIPGIGGIGPKQEETSGEKNIFELGEKVKDIPKKPKVIEIGSVDNVDNEEQKTISNITNHKIKNKIKQPEKQIDKNVIGNEKEKQHSINYNEEEKQVEFTIILKGIRSIKEILLDLSEQKLKIEYNEYYS